MAQSVIDLNSKRTLLTYLIIVGFLLFLWFSGRVQLKQDQRAIPQQLTAYLFSPARPLAEMLFKTELKSVLTHDFFNGKWTFVYFSHPQCLPQCQPALHKLQSIQQDLASADIEIMVIDLLPSKTAALEQYLNDNQYVLTVASVESGTDIKALLESFEMLYLQTDYEDGSYSVEQQHQIYLIDPKARVYAQFLPEVSANKIVSTFIRLRQFYAKSEH